MHDYGWKNEREKEGEQEPGARCEVQFQALRSVLCSIFTLLSFHGAKLNVKTPYNILDGESIWSCRICHCRSTNFIMRRLSSQSFLQISISESLILYFAPILCRHAPFCHTFIFLPFLLPFHSPFRVSPWKVHLRGLPATKGEIPIHSLCSSRCRLSIAVGNVVCVGIIRQTCDKSVNQGVLFISTMKVFTFIKILFDLTINLSQIVWWNCIHTWTQ